MPATMRARKCMHAGQQYAKSIRFQLYDCRSENNLAWRMISYDTYTDRDHIRGIYRIVFAVVIQDIGDQQVKGDRKVKKAGVLRRLVTHRIRWSVMSEVPELRWDETRNHSRPHTIMSHPVHSTPSCLISVLSAKCNSYSSVRHRVGRRVRLLVVVHDRQTAVCHKCISRQIFHCPKRATSLGFLQKAESYCLKI